MKFEDFLEWCDEREYDKYWEYGDATLCRLICKDVNRRPLWSRDRAWKRLNERYNIECGIVDVINKNISSYVAEDALQIIKEMKEREKSNKGIEKYLFSVGTLQTFMVHTGFRKYEYGYHLRNIRYFFCKDYKEAKQLYTNLYLIKSKTAKDNLSDVVKSEKFNPLLNESDYSDFDCEAICCVVDTSISIGDLQNKMSDTDFTNWMCSR